MTADDKTPTPWPDDECLNQWAALLDVPLPEEYLAGVRAHLEAASAMAKRVYAVPLPDHLLCPAPVFAAAPETEE